MKKYPIVEKVTFNGEFSHYIIHYFIRAYRLDFGKEPHGSKYMKLTGIFGRIKGYWNYELLPDDSIDITYHRYFGSTPDIILRDVAKKAKLNIKNIPSDTLEIEVL